MSEAAWKVCGIAGSLRRDSYNRALLREARELAPGSLDIEIFRGLGDVPLFNQDIESDDPDAVRALRAAIREADGLLIVSPEYNGGVPGVLKNGIDWASRRVEGGASVLARKPVAVMGATPGRLGTARAQAQLRAVLAGTGAVVMPQPQVHVARAGEAFVDGRLTDEPTAGFVSRLLEAFAAWIDRFQD